MSHNALHFSVDRENNTITVQREFAAERSVLWEAYTKPEILDLWWAPKPWKAKTKSIDFKEGGHWLYAMVGPEGEEHWSVVNYKVIEPQTTFTGTDAFTDSDGTVNPDMPQSNWEVTFVDKGNNATLVTTQIAFPNLQQLDATIAMGFKDGYRVAMEGLDNLLTTLK